MMQNYATINNPSVPNKTDAVENILRLFASELRSDYDVNHTSSRHQMLYLSHYMHHCYALETLILVSETNSWLS